MYKCVSVKIRQRSNTSYKISIVVIIVHTVLNLIRELCEHLYDNQDNFWEQEGPQALGRSPENDCL